MCVSARGIKQARCIFCATEPVFRCVFCDLSEIFIVFFVIRCYHRPRIDLKSLRVS